MTILDPRDGFITGTANGEVIYGSLIGNNAIVGSLGNDTIHGGAGTDIVNYSLLNTPGISVGLSAYNGSVTKGGANGVDTLTSIEQIFGADAPSSYNLSNGIYQVSGGSANDLYYIDNGNDVIIENSGGGAGDAVFATVNVTLAANLEGLYLLPGATAGTGNNNVNGNSLVAAYDYVGVTLTSGGANTYFYGSALADVMNGGAGTNTFYGWAGADTYNGGTGANNYYLTNVGSVIHQAASHGQDVVYSALSTYVLPTGIDIVFTYSDTDPLTGNPVVAHGATGNGGNDAFIGVYATVSQTFTATGSGNNTFYASSHGDTFNGSTGNDTFFGGAGNDVMHGGGGTDTFFLTHAGSTADDIAGSTAVIYAGFNYTLTSGTHTDVLFIYGSATTATGNNEGDLIVGSYISTGATLTGGTGNDQIIGGAGNDAIDGGLGSNTLSGAGGIDTFVFHAGYGLNTITDFAASGVGADKIDVHLLYANFAAVQAHLTQSGTNAVITVDATHALTLTGITAANLTAANFLF